MVETSHGSTFVRISGPQESQPLLLLPGGRTSSLLWAMNIAMLAERHRVYTVDNIMDHGRSIPSNEPRSADDFVVWLDELFDALELEAGTDLGGLSFGGWISSRYALARPERLRRVVLIAPAATILPMRGMFLLRAMLAMLPPRWCTKQLLYWLHGEILNESLEQKALADRGVDAMFRGTQAYKLPTNFVAPDVFSDEELRRLGETPTLFLVGENERIYSAEGAVQRIRAVAPEIRVEVVPNGGHVFTATHPTAVNERILAFLR